MTRQLDTLPPVQPLLYDVQEAATALRLSRSVIYELIRSLQLRAALQGRRRLVPVGALAERVITGGLEVTGRRAPGQPVIDRGQCTQQPTGAR